MRIVSGKFKNKRLYFPNNLKTRPLKDSVRENIFNILEHSNNVNVKLKDASILDLYAGTGSFGLECLSREASQVLFVENDQDALTNLKKNIKNLNLDSQSIIYDKNILEFFKHSDHEKKIDIAFLDPPYANKKYEEIIKIIKTNNILRKKHILILHREKRSSQILFDKENVIENRVYGRSEIFFLKLF
tara:strand:+ start:1327 stop:1890 length:564 start_codon:yes stop_codon:yes gene_type:complete